MSVTVLAKGSLDGNILTNDSNEVKTIDMDALSSGDHVLCKKDGSNDITHVLDNGEAGAARRVYYVTKT